MELTMIVSERKERVGEGVAVELRPVDGHYFNYWNLTADEHPEIASWQLGDRFYVHLAKVEQLVPDITSEQLALGIGLVEPR